MAMEKEEQYVQKIVPHHSLMAPQPVLVQQQASKNIYTANYMQGPPPLISDRLKHNVVLINQPSATTPQAAAKTHKQSHHSPPTNSAENLAGIPGVYFGYQIQEEQMQEEQMEIDQPTVPTPSQESIVAIEPANKSPAQVEAVTVKQEKNSPKLSPTTSQSPAPAVILQPPPPPALIPTPTSGTTKSENSYLTQQILKSTSTLFNFIQLQVLSSINTKTNSNDSLAMKESPSIGKDRFRTVPNFVISSQQPNNQHTGYQSQSLTNYQQNFIHDLRIATPITHYTNSSPRTPHMQSIPPIDLQHSYSSVIDADLFGDEKKKRQKKTREEKLAYLRQYARERRARETPEQREARLADLRSRQRARKANETPEQRKLRLEKDRLKTGRYRAKKRLDEMDKPRTILGGSIASGPFILSD